MRYYVAGIALFIVAVIGVTMTNTYMLQGTKNFKNTTRHLVGEWNVVYYKDDGKDLLAMPFAGGKATFDFENRSLELVMELGEEALNDKLAQWHARWPELDVRRYQVVVKTSWRVAGDGKELVLGDMNGDVVLEGNGEHLGPLTQWERRTLLKSQEPQEGHGMAAYAASMANDDESLMPPLRERFRFGLAREKRELNLFHLSGLMIKLRR